MIFLWQRRDKSVTRCTQGRGQGACERDCKERIPGEVVATEWLTKAKPSGGGGGLHRSSQTGLCHPSSTKLSASTGTCCSQAAGPGGLCVTVATGSVTAMASAPREKWGPDWRVSSRCWSSTVGLGLSRMLCHPQAPGEQTHS